MIKTSDIVPINGVGKPSLLDRIKALFPKNPDIQPSAKYLEMYNQGKNPFCTVFATATALTYNTGRVFTNMWLEVWGRNNIKGEGSIPWATVSKWCKGVDAQFVTINWLNAQDYLSAGYAVVISVKAPLEMFRDGINDWSIDNDYQPDVKISHAIAAVYREWKYYLINSWANYNNKSLHNMYKIKGKLLDKILKTQVCYLPF